LEVFGALAARIDSETNTEVAPRTIAYLRRRAWRYLRRTAQGRPACYADAAAAVLAHYPSESSWRGTWVANHILSHEAAEYDRSRFRLELAPSGLNDRAFATLWQRSPRPLFGLLERAKGDWVRHFAGRSLMVDFRASLREVEPEWVARIVGVDSV